MNELYRTFTGKLGVDHQSGYIISTTDDGELKIEFFSVHTDTTDTISFVAQTDEYSEESSWTKELANKLIQSLSDGAIDILATYDKDYPFIRQEEHNRRKKLVALSLRLPEVTRNAFRNKCEENGQSQAAVLLSMIEKYIISF